MSNLDKDRGSWAPASLSWHDHGIALGIFALVFALLMATMDIGFTRDESFYFHAGREYLGWFEELAKHWRAGNLGESFTQANVDKHWSYNPEHPALMKTLFGLSLALFHKKLGWLSETTAMRLPTAAMSAWLCSLVFLFGRQLRGRLVGVLAVGALLLQPRAFFHMHMACFDAPIVAVWFAVVYAYWRSMDSMRWVWFAGLLWGVALATKLNAFFIPVVLVVHWLAMRWREIGITKSEEGIQVRAPAIPKALIAMALLGPLVFYLHWPRIWFDTFARVKWYMEFHLTHTHYFVYYFGQNLYTPPFTRAFPWVMTLVTVPLSILLAFALGAVAWWQERAVYGRVIAWKEALQRFSLPDVARDPRGTGGLFLLNIIFPIALIAQPETPIFGGTKHWMTAMPFLAIVAGWGAVAAARWASELFQGTPREKLAATVCAALASLAMLLPAAIQLEHNHPYGTSYYNELIGSHRGAADKKMMRQFWGYAVRGAATWLDENAEPNAKVWTGNATSWAWSEYQREEIIRKDLRATGLGGSDYAILFHQKSFYARELEIWSAYKTRAPVYVLELDGVPLVSIYRRRK